MNSVDDASPWMPLTSDLRDAFNPILGLTQSIEAQKSSMKPREYTIKFDRDNTVGIRRGLQGPHGTQDYASTVEFRLNENGHDEFRLQNKPITYGRAQRWYMDPEIESSSQNQSAGISPTDLAQLVTRRDRWSTSQTISAWVSSLKV